MSVDSVLMLTQKYNEGEKISEYCQRLASHLKEKDVETHLVCFGDEDVDEKVGSINLHKFSFKMHGDNYFSWSMLLQSRFMEKIDEIVEKKGIDVIHANNWPTLPASLTASKLHELPFVVTYHSIEEERGMDNPHSHQISNLEWEGIEEASFIVVHSERTKEAMEVYELPENKVKLLTNEDWENDVEELYRRAVRVNTNLENMEKEAEDNNGNFDAYVGVSSE
ncbi:MAG: glycosyltransferase family 4 protein [Candidatus Aenigmatarchaeota archaeon]